uniref:Uncharacterized protein n=1 Tax=viral metagenome TaxID=1070528 RepID=A0A6C0KC47_9ZZZZ
MVALDTKVKSVIGILVLLGAIYLTRISPLGSPDSWSPEPDNKKKSKENTHKRGTFLSALVGIIGTIMIYILSNQAKAGNESSTMNAVLLWWGFIIGPIMGYLLDIGFGSEVGLANAFTMKGMRYTFGQLPSWNFFRYCVTVLLDIFISTPILDGIKVVYGTSALKKNLSTMLSTQIPGAIQSFVSFITFKAYTNQTRFQWAYPDINGKLADRWGGKLVALATAVSAASFVGYCFLKEDFVDATLKNSVGGKMKWVVPSGVSASLSERLVYVCVAILSLYILDEFGQLDSPHSHDDLEVDHSHDEVSVPVFQAQPTNGTAVVGVCIFTIICVVGMVIIRGAAKE